VAAYDAIIMAIEATSKLDLASVRDVLAKMSLESSRGSFKFDEKGRSVLSKRRSRRFRSKRP
jgi:ABC-type branched-subunit amino acid transport system substrate-binding protein